MRFIITRARVLDVVCSLCRRAVHSVSVHSNADAFLCSRLSS